MAWHRLTHRTTGEVQIVASLDGIDPAQWEAVRIKANRAPTEAQVVNDDGTLSPAPPRPPAPSLDDLLARIEALEERVRKLETRT